MRKKILLVDDILDAHLAVHDSLSRAGFDVDVALDAEGALGLSAETLYDLVVVAVACKGAGDSLVSRLRYNNPLGRPAVLGLVGEGQGASHAGVDGWVEKPLREDEFLFVVRSLLRRPASGSMEVYFRAFGMAV